MAWHRINTSNATESVNAQLRKQFAILYAQRFTREA